MWCLAFKLHPWKLSQIIGGLLNFTKIIYFFYIFVYFCKEGLKLEQEVLQTDVLNNDW